MFIVEQRYIKYRTFIFYLLPVPADSITNKKPVLSQAKPRDAKFIDFRRS